MILTGQSTLGSFSIGFQLANLSAGLQHPCYLAWSDVEYTLLRDVKHTGGLIDALEPRDSPSPLSSDERCIKGSRCHLTFKILFYTLSRISSRFPRFLPPVIPFPVSIPSIHYSFFKHQSLSTTR